MKNKWSSKKPSAKDIQIAPITTSHLAFQVTSDKIGGKTKKTCT